MANVQTPAPNLAQLLEYSPDELSSGVLIANWVQSKSLPGALVFDLSQIEPEAKDSVTKYLNWVCLNAKVFNNFGILLNSSQINNFIEGKSTEIYIILKQLHNKIKERTQSRPAIESTKSAPSPSIPNNAELSEQPVAAKKIKSTTALGHRLNPIKPITPILTSPQFKKAVNVQSKSVTNQQQYKSLSLAISPTISHDRIEKVGTSTKSNVYTNEHHQHSNVESKDIASNIVIGTINEQEAEETTTKQVNPLSLLSPDLKDVVPAPEVSKSVQFRSNIQKPNDSNSEKIKNPIDAFEQFEDYVVYDGIKLFDKNVEDFLNEKEKLESKMNDAMTSYESNNVQYLSNIVEQYRTQKLKICQNITDQTEQNNFLQKLQHDLEILNKSLKLQFEESKKTLYNQLISIHHNRLKEFAMKLNQQSVSDKDKASQSMKNEDPTPSTVELQTSINVNNQNINISNDEEEENELNMTLKEVSNLLEKCWKKELNKQQKQRTDKEKEIGTLKEILSVYQNLSKLVQLQSTTLETTIADFHNLCHESYSNEEHDISITQISSPDKMHIPYDRYYQEPNNAQIQLLSSADAISKPYYRHYASNEEQGMSLVRGNSARKKRRKSWNKKSTTRNNVKTPAFSFVDPKYNRQTVSSYNKNVKSVKRATPKRKVKKSKKNT